MARRYCSCLEAASEDWPLSLLSFLKVSTTTLVKSSRPCRQQCSRCVFAATDSPNSWVICGHSGTD